MFGAVAGILILIASCWAIRRWCVNNSINKTAIANRKKGVATWGKRTIFAEAIEREEQDALSDLDETAGNQTSKIIADNGSNAGS